MRRISAPVFAAVLLGLPAVALAQDANARLGTLESQMGQARIQVAQLFGRPPADVPGGDQYQQAQDDDETNATVRLGRLENEMRNLTGQIEQLQFQQRRLDEQMRKMQQDIDFRFQDLQNSKGGARQPGKRTELNDPEPNVQTGSITPPQGQGPVVADDNPPPQPGVVTGVRRGDAFDPNALPNAPGAPRQLGSTQPSAPLRNSDGQRPVVAGGQTSGPMDLSGSGVQPAPGPAMSPSPGGGRSAYDMAVSQYKLGQLAEAEAGFKDFIAKNPKDRMAPDATYYLAQTYFREGRHREAAEQYLKFTTDYPNAPRAPESLLHLGTSLDALGAREQACATFQEVNRRYPNAAPAIRANVDREIKRAGC